MTGSEGRYSLVYVTQAGWDYANDEAREGGRCVRTCETVEGAIHALHCYQGVAHLEWGPGHLGVTDGEGRLVYSPTLLPGGRRPWTIDMVRADLARSA